MSVSTDVTEYPWRVKAGQRNAMTFTILDDADDNPFPIPDWVVDAKIRAYPGGEVLYTWPDEFAQIVSAGLRVRLTIPKPVSLAWRFTNGWYRLVATDPDSDPADPSSSRVIQGPLIVDPD